MNVLVRRQHSVIATLKKKDKEAVGVCQRVSVAIDWNIEQQNQLKLEMINSALKKENTQTSFFLNSSGPGKDLIPEFRNYS